MQEKTHYPIAFCPSCGPFEFRLIGMTNSSLTLTNVQTNCPRCNREAEVIPGEYNSMGERLRLLVDPSISPQALQAIRQITQKLQNGEISEQQANEEAEKIAPAFAGLFNLSDWSNEAKATLYAGILAASTTIGATVIAANNGGDTYITNNYYSAQTHEETTGTIEPLKKDALAPSASPRPVLRPGRFKNSTSLAPSTSLRPKLR